jgi:hypothetical protein
MLMVTALVLGVIGLTGCLDDPDAQGQRIISTTVIK